VYNTNGIDENASREAYVSQGCASGCAARAAGLLGMHAQASKRSDKSWKQKGQITAWHPAEILDGCCRLLKVY
jgi:hypothetical protein